MPSCRDHRKRRIGKWKRLALICCLAPALTLPHCSARTRCASEAAAISAPMDAGHPIYTIQVGAFSNPDNAARVVERLRLAGVEAYLSSTGNRFHRIRFGEFPSREMAEKKAAHFAAKGVIHEYLVVKTAHSPVWGIREGESFLRDKIVETTKKFIGLPYSWGCASQQEGYDCSGLTMAVYRLNGLTIPRSSLGQWTNGTPVRGSGIKKGDLVFFTINGKGDISHVGIYMGTGNFAHAPGKGKKIRIDSLSSNYFKFKFAGARTYL